MARLFLPIVVLVVILSFASLAISNPRAGQQRLDMWEDVYWHIMKPCVKTGWFLFPNTYRQKNTLQKHHSNLELAPEFNEAINILSQCIQIDEFTKRQTWECIDSCGIIEK